MKVHFLLLSDATACGVRAIPSDMDDPALRGEFDNATYTLLITVNCERCRSTTAFKAAVVEAAFQSQLFTGSCS